ncbi:DUF3592 domain-containing protein [Humibacter sp.]|uniref:DUF3592 domain-containing protein n=1 Tax=Humibacter sp. TaxID=1940291 RepID=UPI002B69E789|nr:DUF3592 domain-containing protein [Humibacter sp.]HVX07314.1 DUF3592 domain-containing protein [Humibacter sp.]
MTQKKTAQQRKKKAGPGYISTAVVLALGAVFFVGGLIPLVGQIVLASHSSTASAVVVGYRTHPSGGKGGCGGPAYEPVVAFDAGGSKATATLSNKLICTAPSKGAEVQVLYDTTNPSNAEFPSASQNWAWPIVAVVVGALLILAAAAMARSTRRTRAAIAGGGPVPGSRNQARKRERARERDLDRRASGYVQTLAQQRNDAGAVHDGPTHPQPEHPGAGRPDHGTQSR